ncbi:hypothetical protein SK128_008326 [Halocaridina rubra]|uniref:Uncharacterized protein n=1 Tax=Halocaridina rubra TaxID=373956 RepID=A0AAN8ZT09_HALRR
MVDNTRDQPSEKEYPPKSKDWLKNAGIGMEKRRRSSSANNYRIENNKMIIENEDGTIQELEIVSSKDKHGKLRKAVPTLPLSFAIICLLLNIVPGLGNT